MAGTGPNNVRYLIPILLFCVSALAFAEPVRVPGTRVWIDVPPGFELAADFQGLVGTTDKITITVAEVPSSFVELNNTYSDSGLQKKDVVVESRRSLERDGLRTALITGTQHLPRQTLIKKILLTGDISESLLVTATYLDKDAQRLGPTVDEAFAKLTWDSSRDLDHFDGLGFRLKEIPGLRVATRAGNSIIFTEDGKLPDQYYTGQMFIVGWSKGDVTEIENPRSFAVARFKGIRLMDKIELDNVVGVTLDGTPGFEIVGRGRHRHLGFSVAAFQVMLTYPDRFLLAQGFSNVKDPEAAYDQFRTILSTLATDKN